MNKRNIGKEKEELAGIYLNANGIKHIQYNYRCRVGEIDLIGMDKGTLVFFEVKYRASDNSGYASDAVDYKKQYKICRVSDQYRMVHHISDFSAMRFDVIAIDGNNITWHENAFDYIPK